MSCEKFLQAQPVWPVGRQTEMNCQVGFRTILELSEGVSPVLRIAASSIYRVFVNSVFIGHGPARGPRDYFRIDEWPLDGFVHTGTNLVAIEAVGYNVNGYYLLDQPAFVQAEIAWGNELLASTGCTDSEFVAFLLPERIQKVPRYSFQRPFVEVYQLDENSSRWRQELVFSSDPIACELCSPKSFLPRRLPLPKWNRRKPLWRIASGKMITKEQPDSDGHDRSLTEIGELLKGFRMEELEVNPGAILQSYQSRFEESKSQLLDPDCLFSLNENDFSLVDFGCNLTGMIGLDFSVSQSCELFMTFDEILTPKGDVDFTRLSCLNAIVLNCGPGRYRFESIEPYTLRYLKVFVRKGKADIHGLYLRELVNPEIPGALFFCSHSPSNRIFQAAVETFRQNAVDIFMDCPSRERAGWLCDSFFTARAAKTLTGNCSIETNQFENYLLPDRFPDLPEGMLPMCYPADQRDGRFIPQWALWFVLQLQEYRNRDGQEAIVQALEKRVLELFAYLERFRNSDGLLERLESWNFVEWSKANDFVWDVNYPTNMLYAAAMDAAADLYAIPALTAEAKQLRQTIRAQSFDGDFFVDNALRQDGKLVPTRNRTEVCQYYAFFFGIANPDTHARLWSILVDRFGPERKKTGHYPDIHPANAFIGHILRVELLSRHHLQRQLHSEIEGYYGYMADKTGTLWEFDDLRASCNHGFASHIAHVYLRDLLGVAHIDYRSRSIVVTSSDTFLDWCSGWIPLPEGWLQIEWLRKESQQKMRIHVPYGYHIRIDPAAENLELLI
ncbi:hypothetical protein JW992_01140 [candidate division KSB1 bacterium]|nr:hypothetical protein [candidate division KSB1 bacterium]